MHAAPSPKMPSPEMKNLVLVGGGHSHMAVLKGFGLWPMPGVRVTLISREAHTPYSGMLPGLIAGHYRFDEAHIDLVRLSRFAGARFIHDEAIGLDPDKREIRCRSQGPVAFDVLSINIGSAPRMAGFPGAEANAVPVKPIDRFLDRWQGLVERALARPGRSRIGVVGAGAGGVELLLAAQYRLGNLFIAAGRNSDAPVFHLFADTPHILPGHNGLTRRKFQAVLAARGVAIHTGQAVVAVEEGALRLADGSLLALDEVLWATPAGAAPWLKASGLASDSRGFVAVSAALQSRSHAAVFAAGDVAAVIDHPRPKAGVFAVRQGEPLARNLRLALAGRPALPFVPQRHYLSLISTGDRYAVAVRGPWELWGRWVWRWKDRIDRRFMRQYQALPETPARPPAGAPAAPMS